MIILNEEIISKIDRIRRFNKLKIAFNYTFYLLAIVSTLVAVFFNMYEHYSVFIMSLILSKGAVSCISYFFDDKVEEILEVVQYNHSKFKYNIIK